MSIELNDRLSDRLTAPPGPDGQIAPARSEPGGAPGQTFSGDGNSSGGAKRKPGRRVLVLGSALVVGVVALVYYTWRILPYESTDDAFIEGHVTQIAPQVAGRVSDVLVRDNQFVNAGEVLVQIEPSD